MVRSSTPAHRGTAVDSLAGTATANHRRQEQLARHRERILDAIALCFAERGYHETSVDHVVARARTSKSAFYACFTNKESAFAALLDRQGERLLRDVATAVAAEPDPLHRVGRGVSTFVHGCAGDAATARILLLESVGISAEIESRRRALHARFAAMVREQAEAVRGSGAGPAGVDGEVVAFAVVGAVNEAVVHMLERGTPPAAVVAALTHVVTRTLAA